MIIYTGVDAQKGEAASSVGNGSSSEDEALELIRREIAEKLGISEDKKEVLQEVKV